MMYMYKLFMYIYTIQSMRHFCKENQSGRLIIMQGLWCSNSYIRCLEHMQPTPFETPPTNTRHVERKSIEHLDYFSTRLLFIRTNRIILSRILKEDKFVKMQLKKDLDEEKDGFEDKKLKEHSNRRTQKWRNIFQKNTHKNFCVTNKPFTA